MLPEKLFGLVYQFLIHSLAKDNDPVYLKDKRGGAETREQRHRRQAKELRTSRDLRAQEELGEF